MAAGAKRNFQILDPLDFLAEFTQHIPPKGSHLIRYSGWYSSKSRGLRNKAEAEAVSAESSKPSNSSTASRARCSKTWAMLIKRVYEIDPMNCTQCGGEMEVVSFIDPPQSELVEKSLRGHRRAAMVDGLWQAPDPRGPPDSIRPDHDPVSGLLNQTSELTFVDIDTIMATF